MRSPRRHLAAELTAELTAAFQKIRADQHVSETFPPEATALALERAANQPTPPPARSDRRDIELLSIDPEGSRDLDQALHIERRGSGYRFNYAIADVGAWVTAGDAIDLEARRRGTTVYCPDRRVPLHPVELSEGVASLLADVDRPAVLWTIDLDQRGEIADIAVERALVRNRRALSYAGVQAALDEGSTDEQFRLIEEVGLARTALESERGGVSLQLPEQTVDRVDDHYQLSYEGALVIEGHNAQLSLCCGIAAARLMVGAGFGLLRTLPPADPITIDRIRASSLALGQQWPEEMTYAQWVRTLDAATPTGAALMVQAARTLRGAGYLAFDGNLPATPSERAHSAIAAEYAHVTAPLRRMIDRFANECVLAAAAGTRPPAWVTDAFAELPGQMAAAGRTASAVDHAAVDLMEAAVLMHRVGETFEATVTSNSRGFSTVQLSDPAVIGSVAGTVPLGTVVQVRLDAADISGPTVRFSAVEPSAVEPSAVEPSAVPPEHD